MRELKRRKLTKKQKIILFTTLGAVAIAVTIPLTIMLTRKHTSIVSVTQAQIDARDAKGPFPTKENALNGKAIVGKNSAKAEATGDGSGKTYTQAQIDHAKGGDLVAPPDAIVGENTANRYDVDENMRLTAKSYDGNRWWNNMTLFQIILNGFMFKYNLTKPNFGGMIKKNITLKQFEDLVNTKFLDSNKVKKYKSQILSYSYSKNHRTNFEIDDNGKIKFLWYKNKLYPGKGAKNGKTYKKSQIDARDAKGPFPTKENALNGKAIVGKNSAKAEATGDGSGKTYTQAQIDHAKGGNFVAPPDASAHVNESMVAKIYKT